ncbi:tetratricopeptide repeat protein [Niveispirillum sp. KHB5.9]|uniref:tetratricopeptide repeat protein n=1 Tax=Niveispirillum sp. KHB5.9 TaxID=3400269 RepID=UPI003A892B47
MGFIPFAATLVLLASAGVANAQTVPADYAALVEPDDRQEVAAKPLKDRLAADPGDKAAARDLLLVYQRFGDFEAGLPLGAKLAAETPDDRAVLEARMVLATRRIDDASLFSKKSAAADLLSLCEGERTRDPRSIPAINCVAQFHLVAPSIAGGDKEKAEAAIRQMQPLDEGQYLLLRANQAFSNEDEAGGKARLMEAVAKLTDASDLAGAGTRLGRLGDNDAAFAALDKAAALDPADTFTLYQRGRATAVTGQRLEAGRDSLLRFLSGSAWIGGTNYRAGAHWRLGQIYQAMGDKVTAEKAFRRALVLEPKHKEAQAALKALKAAG